MSNAFPSPPHQETRSDGGETHLHLPALRALAIAAISSALRARLKISTSSIRPLNNSAGESVLRPIVRSPVLVAINPVLRNSASKTPLMYIFTLEPSYVPAM